MAKNSLNSPRRAPRFSPSADATFFLPSRTPPPNFIHPKTGFHTYYLSCDSRGLAVYLPHTVKHHHRGFRAAFLAPAGLEFSPPSIVLMGLQDGDAFEHAMRWASTNPIEEIHLEAIAQKRVVTLKTHEKAQERFAEAIATLQGVEDARLEAEKELEVATAELISIQGVESINIEGSYYDATYSREKVYLKRRDPRLNPEAWAESTAPEKPKKRGKKASKRSRRAA